MIEWLEWMLLPSEYILDGEVQLFIRDCFEEEYKDLYQMWYGKTNQGFLQEREQQERSSKFMYSLLQKVEEKSAERKNI